MWEIVIVLFVLYLIIAIPYFIVKEFYDAYQWKVEQKEEKRLAERGIGICLHVPCGKEYKLSEGRGGWCFSCIEGHEAFLEEKEETLSRIKGKPIGQLTVDELAFLNQHDTAAYNTITGRD